MKILYRISDTGYKKIKPHYINNENCLKNFSRIFNGHDITIIADNICIKTYEMITKYIDPSKIQKVSVGHGAGTFNLALDQALTFDDNEIVYFVENDYLHIDGASSIITEGFSLPFSFVSLYDHPDKYIDPSINKTGNPFCLGGAEDTRVYLTKSCHWKITNSTTMTFASRVSTLKRTETIIRKYTNINDYSYDFPMFLELKQNKELLITSIPGYSTHGETAYLTPLINWENVL